MTTAASPQVRQVRVVGHDVRVSVRPAVREPGTEPGIPLLLCNGIGASLDLLQPFVDEVDPRIEVISFDVPGVGGSPDPLVPYNFAALAWFVGKLLDRLGHDTYDVLGISWGGGLAQQLAFHNPRRCRRLVLVSTATGSLMVPASPRVLRKMVTPKRYRDPDYAVRVAAELYGGRLREDPARVRELMHDRSRVGSRRGYLLQLLAGAGWSSLPALPFLRQETLVLAGLDDPIIPLVNARIMQRLIPRARLRVYDDGHLGLVTSADTLGPEVSRFLLRNEERVSPSGA
ncbi:poly(3-hydroxyalkanoate) depolymerase [Nocardioides humilatus]|uniref:Poly(3-hydroxyalkanoate) depolymerase n=1 Tax=Nocardioides humilatus TaxID=2607660 RepID=A0A5B1LJN7_9ACTN|nr:poly(3-hydroxyalkanoate) depolymerase [Nocardioides humilatus]KAA1420945.1 poly(3-hydroxyalkanoate) depolymerase [Nocardioides humilatus]